MDNGHNIILKAFYDNFDKAIDLCRKSGASHIKTNFQKDIYYKANKGQLKYRDDSEYGKQLISYDRLANSIPRSCHYNRMNVTPYADDIHKLLSDSIGVKAVVEKDRTVFETENARINVDKFQPIGNFIEIEVFVEKAGSFENGLKIADDFSKMLEIDPGNLVAFSYADLALMYEKAELWREKLKSRADTGRLFLVDGCSCSGKTSLTQQLFQEQKESVNFIRRYTTRERRKNENTETEYVFVDIDRFHKIASVGGFLEYRDFEFGMSYGLSWEDVMTPLLNGQDALGIINFGNILHVKKIFPEAITILIDAPLDTIHKRLKQRGYNAKEQIDERMNNAQLVTSYKKYYDQVIDNDDGNFDKAYDRLNHIICENS